jgi:acyl-CoA thioesterase-1
MDSLVSGMRRFRSVRYLAFWFLVGLVAAPATAETRTILVVGDSLSAAFGIEVGTGWVALLQQRLDRQRLGYKVVNASISGDTTANGLARLPALLQQHRPRVVVIQLGGNDGLRGLPPEQMKHNIASMTAKAKAQGAQVLIVGVPLPPNYGRLYIDKFQQAYRDAATEHSATLVPSLLDGTTDRTFMQRDGIHPTVHAQPKMLENVWPALRAML